MRPAFSTIACPTWTLDQVARFAATSGYLGVELATGGPSNVDSACEPCQTAGEKIRDLLEDAGVRPVALATSVRFDEPVWPPVLGRAIGDFEKPVRRVKQLVEVAAGLECPYLRVFAFELPDGERRGPGLRRITERLDLAVRTARNTGVRLVLENGGSFPLASDLREIIDLVGLPDLLACYDPAVARAAGEQPATGVRLLGHDLAVVRVKDIAAGRAVPLGQGPADVPGLVRALAQSGFTGWVVNTWTGPLLGDRADPSDVLRADAESLYRWWAEAGGGPIRDTVNAA